MNFLSILHSLRTYESNLKPLWFNGLSCPSNVTDISGCTFREPLGFGNCHSRPILALDCGELCAHSGTSNKQKRTKRQPCSFVCLSTSSGGSRIFRKGGHIDVGLSACLRAKKFFYPALANHTVFRETAPT